MSNDNKLKFNDTSKEVEIMPIRNDHPFLEISANKFNNEVFFDVSFRPTVKVNDIPVCDTLEFYYKIVGLLPDYSMITKMNMPGTVDMRCQDHLMGTVMNQFMLSVAWQDRANIMNLQLFPKKDGGGHSSEIDFDRLTLLLQLLFRRFTMLHGQVEERKSPDGDEELVFFLKGKGKWTTFEGEELPKLNGVTAVFNKKKIQTEYEGLLSEFNGSFSDVNDAIKSKFISVLSSSLYSMSFDGDVSEQLLIGPHDRINFVKKPITLSEILQNRIDEQKLVGPGGAEIDVNKSKGRKLTIKRTK